MQTMSQMSNKIMKELADFHSGTGEYTEGDTAEVSVHSDDQCEGEGGMSVREVGE